MQIYFQNLEEPLEIGELAKDVYNEDKIIKQAIDNIVEKEKRVIDDYEKLRNLKASYPNKRCDMLENELEKRRLYLAYKMQSKQDQCNALIKLLEYINVLDEKSKKTDSENVISKITLLKSNIEPYMKLLN